MAQYTLLNKRLHLCGAHYKSTEDALWLAASLSPNPEDTVLDVGAGNGAVGLSLALLHGAHVTCLEKCSQLYKSLQRGILHSNLPHVDAQQTDWLKNAPQGRYQYVVSNPPYHLQEEGFTSTYKQSMHGITSQDLSQWIHHCAAACCPTGQVFMFLSWAAYQNQRELLIRLGLWQVITLHSHPTKPAKACIICLAPHAPKRSTKPQHMALHTYDEQTRHAVLKHGKKIKAYLVARP